AESTAISVFERLLRMDLDEGGDVISHLNEMEQLHKRLIGTNMAIPDVQLTVIAMRSLPPSYYHFLTALRGNRKIERFQDFKRILIEEQENRQVTERKVENSENGIVFKAVGGK